MNRDMKKETPSVTVVTKSCDIEMRIVMRMRSNIYYYHFASCHIAFLIGWLSWLHTFITWIQLHVIATHHPT